MSRMKSKRFFLCSALAALVLALAAVGILSAVEDDEVAAPTDPAAEALEGNRSAGTQVDAVITDEGNLRIRIDSDADLSEDGSEENRQRGIVRFGKDYEVGPDEIVTDDVVIFGGDLVVKGKIYGDAVVFGGQCRVEGEVSGDIVMIGGSVLLGPEAEVNGDLVIIGGELEREPGAVIRGEQVELAGLFKDMGLPGLTLFGAGLGLIFWLSTFVMFLFIALLAAILFPNQLESVADLVRREPAPSLAAGFLGLLAAIVVIVVLAVTILGIPVAILIAVGMVALQYFGRAAICLSIGRWIFDRTGIRWAFPFWAMAVGYLAIRLVELIPFVGGVVRLLLFIAGLGCVTLAIWRSRKGTPEAPVPAGEVGPGEGPRGSEVAEGPGESPLRSG